MGKITKVLPRAFATLGFTMIVAVVLPHVSAAAREGTYTTEQPVNSSPAISGNVIAFYTNEDLLDRDVNEDRDKDDTILAYYDITTRKATYTTEQPLGRTNPGISGNVIAFYTDEVLLDRDVNEDRDKIDAILAYYDISAGRATYTTEQPLISLRRGGSNPAISGNVIAFYTGEDLLNRDVNGDGDKRDAILAYYDIATGKATYTTEQPVISHTLGGRSSPSISGEVIAFHTDEVVLGRDVNGDGDKNDWILAYYDIATGKATYTTEQPGWSSPAISGNVIVFYTGEDLLNRDVNGDGDKRDRILAYYDIVTGSATYTAEPPTGSPAISGNVIAFYTGEDVLGRDVNGDRDKIDAILAYYDISAGRATYISEPPTGSPAISGDVIAFYAMEHLLNRDLNEDRDRHDVILGYVKIR